MTLLAGFPLLLSRYSNQEDVVVGTPIASRNRPEIEEMIGFFANTLVFRTKFAEAWTRKRSRAGKRIRAGGLRESGCPI